MSSLETALAALGCLMSGVGLGMWSRNLLPGHHLSKEAQDTVKLGAGMVATMSALVLGLLVSSAKNSFDSVNLAIAQNGAKIIQLDHLLSEYGPEASPARQQLKTALADRVEKIWGQNGGVRSVEKSTAMQQFQALLQALKPASDFQKSILAQAQQISSDVWQSRLLLIEQQQEPLPAIFLVLLVFWLTVMFYSFGLFAPRNVTVLGVLFVCALSVSSAVFLILEMDHPLDGYIKASRAPLVKALELIGQ